MMRTLAVVLVLFFGGTATLIGQQAQAEQARGAPTTPMGLLESDAFMDPTAARIYEAARAEWERVDETVIRYTAIVKQRLAARIRTPLKDRTIYNVESAHRVFWDRDGDALNQVLALREQTPAGIEQEDGVDLDWFDDAFDPAGDRLLFGLSEKDEDDWGEPEEEDFWVEHPFGPSALTAYRFQSGDTLTLSFPDGRRILSVELQVFLNGHSLVLLVRRSLSFLPSPLDRDTHRAASALLPVLLCVGLHPQQSNLPPRE